MSGEWISPLNHSTAHINGTHMGAYLFFVDSQEGEGYQPNVCLTKFVIYLAL